MMRTQLTKQVNAISQYAQQQREVVAHHLPGKLAPWLEKHVPLPEPGVPGIAPRHVLAHNDPQGWELMGKLIHLLEHEDLNVAMAAVWEIGQLGSCYIRPVHVGQLTSFLYDQRNRVRGCAAVAFGRLGPSIVDKGVASQLFQLLYDPFADVRAAAVQAVSTVSPHQVQALLDRLCKDESPLVRKSAAQALGDLDSSYDGPEVLKLLRISAECDPEQSVRQAACDSLDWLHEKLTRAPAEVAAAAAGCLHEAEIRVVSTIAEPSPASEKEEKDLTEELEELEELVRAGLPDPAPQRPWHQIVGEKIACLKALLKGGVIFAEDQRLLLANLESEFHDRCGHYHKAAETAAHALGYIEAEEPLEVCLERQIIVGLPRNVLKQRIWLFFTYIWTAIYRVGMFARAAELLEKAHEHMNLVRIQGPEEPWHGTESRWQYYYAHALRGLRLFDKAVFHFMVSTQHTLERLRHKASSGNLRFEKQWASISGARIQGCGQGWILLQRGRLTDAFHTLVAAQLQLEHVGDEFLRLLNDSLLNGASLRLASPRDKSYGEAIKRLLGNAEEYCRLDDYSGAMRCWTEVCRAWLDTAEFFHDQQLSSEAREQAEALLKLMQSRLGPLENEDSRWRVRFDLLRARFEMTPIGPHPALKRRAPHLQERLKAVEGHLNKGHNHGDLLVMAGLLYWHLGDFDKAQSNFISVQTMAGESDDVLLLEAQLLSAWCTSSAIYTVMQRIEISPGAGNESRTRLAKLRDDLDISSNKLTERQASGVENWYLRAMSHRVAELVFSEGERVRKFLARPEVPSYEPPLTVKEVRGPMLAGHATKAS